MLLYETFARGNEAYGRPANPDFLLRARTSCWQLAGARLTVVAFEQGFVADARPGAVVQRLAAVGPRPSVAPGAARPVTARWNADGPAAFEWGKIDPFSRCFISMLTGSLVAIVTPMREGGALDLPALGKLIDLHIANGTAGIVVVGTTGESPTVDFDEHCLLIKTAVEHARGRIPVIAGTGANSTAEAIELTAYAKEAGAHSAPVGRALLQQADAGRALPALPRDRRERSTCR